MPIIKETEYFGRKSFFGRSVGETQQMHRGEVVRYRDIEVADNGAPFTVTTEVITFSDDILIQTRTGSEPTVLIGDKINNHDPKTGEIVGQRVSKGFGRVDIYTYQK